MEIGVESVAVGCYDYSSSWLLAVVCCSGDDDRWCQVALRWIYQQGASVIVKCFNKERMKENLEIFDWELSDEELLQISQISQCKGYSGEPFISPSGPYKSLQELWDEEDP